MIDPHTLAAALGPVRDLVRADGGDLIVEDASAHAVRLRLVLSDAACGECVMPRDFLEQVALDMLQPEVPELINVSIDDPREAGR